MVALWKLETDGGRRLARGPAEQGPQELLPREITIDGLLCKGGDAFREGVFDSPGTLLPESDVRILPPIDTQEVWACGVTYQRSRDARMAESDSPDHYDRVYEAERPELFFKSVGWRVRGPGEPVTIRPESSWDVPEPELALIIDASGEIVAYSIANDMSSRSIEGENPLYLPQAKTYDGACALGPCLVLPEEAPPAEDMVLNLRILRQGRELVTEQVEVSGMRRTLAELVEWLFGSLTFPVGAVLLTGTAIVPEPEFTLRADDEVVINVNGLGELRNPVKTLHLARAAVRPGRPAAP